ncbi:MAG: glycoside hydrolase, partial [Clostridia bacterium]|nr:glycoside hydrolase [Clostridia bacterium]
NDPRVIAGKPCMVTDGPFVVREEDGSLTLFWSSFSRGDYAEGIAVSASGALEGPWEQLPEPLFKRDGGHGMLFRTFDGRLVFTLHRPNRRPDERPAFFEVERRGKEYRLK